MSLGEKGIPLSAKRPLNISEDLKSRMTKGHSGIDQKPLDSIGVESTDSHHDDEDGLPPPSLYTQSRNSYLPRSKSIGSCDLMQSFVYDDNCCSGAQLCTGSTVMPRSKRFASEIKPLQPEPSIGIGMRRSVSMSCIEKSRSDYNRAVGEVLADSLKKEIVSQGENMVIVEKLLSEL